MNKPKLELPKIGQKFGLWKVVDGKLAKGSRYRGVLVECRCGTQRIHALSNLYGKRSQGCKKCCHEDQVIFHNINPSYFKSLKEGALSRNLKFKITIKEIWELFLKQNKKCALSGVDIQMNPHSASYKNKLEQTASLDRIDSKVGYIISNLQWLHKDVNRIKWNLNQDQFLELCRAIVEKHKNKSRVRIISKLEIEGIHRWLKCPIKEVSYLRNYHRHIFKITCYCYVNHNDRDIEFIKLSHDIKKYLCEKYFNTSYQCLFFDDMSCEMIAEELVRKFNLYECMVCEDDEGGSIVTNI